MRRLQDSRYENSNGAAGARRDIQGSRAGRLSQRGSAGDDGLSEEHYAEAGQEAAALGPVVRRGEERRGVQGWRTVPETERFCWR